MNREFFDLAGEVLDHSIVDVNDYPCGKVDDVEIEGTLIGGFRVRAILVGPAAWLHRLPRWAYRIIHRVLDTAVVTIPWEQVQEITPKVKLRLTAAAVGLGQTDERANQLMSRLLGQ
jgi:hypothetical protein